MTREETKKRFQSWCQGYIGNNASDEDYQMFNNIMALLEQEPCGDCISRKAVLDILDDMVKNYVNENDFDKAQGIAWVKVQKLPPVTPQPKTGRWIEHFDEIGIWYECDQCHTDWGGPVNYCPNCGAKMERSYKE